MTRPPLIRLIAAALLLSLAPGGSGSPAIAAPQGPAVEVRTLTGGTFRGVLVGLDGEKLRVRQEGAEAERALPLTEVIDVVFTAGTSSPAAEPAAMPGGEGQVSFQAHLIGGDVLRGAFRGPSAEGLVLDVTGLGSIALSFDVIRTLETIASGVPAGAFERPERRDIAHDLGGDEYLGAVAEATATALVMEVGEQARERKIPWDRLRVLHVENDLLEVAPGLDAEVELITGTRVRVGKNLTMTAKGVRIGSRSLKGSQWEIPFGMLHALRWSGETFVYASDLPFDKKWQALHPDPKEVMDPIWSDPWFGTFVDRRATGKPLRIDGRTYRHGLGLAPETILSFDLAGAYKSFQAGFGIDDAVLERKRVTKMRGNVDAWVIADGKVVWEAKGVRGGEPVRKIGPLDVSGVKTLVLKVGFGGDLDVLDLADWVDPILVRK